MRGRCMRESQWRQVRSALQATLTHSITVFLFIRRLAHSTAHRTSALLVSPLLSSLLSSLAAAAMGRSSNNKTNKKKIGKSGGAHNGGFGRHLKTRRRTRGARTTRTRADTRAAQSSTTAARSASQRERLIRGASPSRVDRSPATCRTQRPEPAQRPSRSAGTARRGQFPHSCLLVLAPLPLCSDLDQIQEDLAKHAANPTAPRKFDQELPGCGQYYCLVCARYFTTDKVLDEHVKSKVHKKRSE